MKPGVPLLLTVLRTPAAMASLGLAQWDLVLRQAEPANLSATLLYLAEEQGVLAALAEPVRERLEWTRLPAQRHRQAVAWEVSQIAGALAPLHLPVVLLKGAAYALADLPAARGRMFSDIDILVPFDRIPEVESALMLDGWVTNTPDAYDQRYYREWMHELPPMQHAKRQTVIDVHHAILPRTAAARPDAGKLRSAARRLPGTRDIFVLAPVDLVLHSAVHLFYEGEFEHGLRGLVDLHRLFQSFGAQPDFGKTLVARARELELGRPLFYALRYCSRMLGTAVPPTLLDAVASEGPGRPLLPLMDLLFQRALLPQHPSCSDVLSSPARFALYVRGNWLRMPPLMLARHLMRKALTQKKSDSQVLAPHDQNA